MNRLLPAVISAFAFISASAFAQTYVTKFDSTENPISEGGHWTNGGSVGLDWTNVSTTKGLAIGHEGGTIDYTDATAILTGTWEADQSAAATVHSVNQNDACYEEVELRLRSSLSPHSCTGYEISMKCSKSSAAYLIIVRWNGPVGDFTVLRELDGSSYGVSDGDSVKATIVGHVITAYINGVQKGTATDTTFAKGNPGMGFNLHGCTGNNSDYGYTSFRAEGNAPQTGVIDGPEEPRNVSLGRNYPNPFNPGTTITYEVSVAGHARLSVFDMEGREVAVLVNGQVAAGTHAVRFTAASLASGIYFYRLAAGLTTQTRKMVLLK